MKHRNYSVLKPLYQVHLIAENGKHTYMWEDGIYRPGVTGILDQLAKHGLPQWAANETTDYALKIVRKYISSPHYENRAMYGFGNFWELLAKRAKKQHVFIKETAGRIGTAAHRVFDAVTAFPTAPLPKGFVYESFDIWRKNEPLKIIQGDTIVGSKIYGYGGSLDAIGQDEAGKLWVLDYKSSKSIYETHAYQVAAYSYAMREQYGLDYYPQGVVVRFAKDKIAAYRRRILDIEKSFQGFKAAFDAYKASQFSHLERSTIYKPKKSKKEKPTNVRA